MGVLKRRKREREIKDGERNFSLLTLAYLTHPSNKVFVPTVMYSSFLTFQELIRLSFSVNIQDFNLIFSALTNMIRCTIHDRQLK